MKTIGRIAGIVLGMLVLVVVLAPLLPLADPYRIDLDSLRLPPSWEHPFGTDSKGRDIFSRVLYGGQISISVALAASVISAFMGFAVGLISGYCGGKGDAMLMALVGLHPLLSVAFACRCHFGDSSSRYLYGYDSDCLCRLDCVCAHCPGASTFIQGDAVCGGGAVIWVQPLADSAASHCSALHTDLSGHDGDQAGRVCADRGDARISRAWRSAADTDLGCNDQRKQGLYSFSSLDSALPGSGYFCDGILL